MNPQSGSQVSASLQHHGRLIPLFPTTKNRMEAERLTLWLAKHFRDLTKRTAQLNFGREVAALRRMRLILTCFGPTRRGRCDRSGQHLPTVATRWKQAAPFPQPRLRPRSRCAVMEERRSIMCYCCRRRDVLPINCNCGPVTCRNCLLCDRHCRCGVSRRTPRSCLPAPHPVCGECPPRSLPTAGRVLPS